MFEHNEDNEENEERSIYYVCQLINCVTIGSVLTRRHVMWECFAVAPHTFINIHAPDDIK